MEASRAFAFVTPFEIAGWMVAKHVERGVCATRYLKEADKFLA